jgi:hypothetical protein
MFAAYEPDLDAVSVVAEDDGSWSVVLGGG